MKLILLILIILNIQSRLRFRKDKLTGCKQSELFTVDNFRIIKIDFTQECNALSTCQKTHNTNWEDCLKTFKKGMDDRCGTSTLKRYCQKISEKNFLLALKIDSSKFAGYKINLRTTLYHTLTALAAAPTICFATGTTNIAAAAAMYAIAGCGLYELISITGGAAVANTFVIKEVSSGQCINNAASMVACNYDSPAQQLIVEAAHGGFTFKSNESKYLNK